MVDKIVAIYGNKAGNFLVFKEGENGVLNVIRDVDIAELINEVAKFVNQPDVIRINTGINEISKNQGDSLSGVFFKKDFLESEYIHFNMENEVFDTDLCENVPSCGLYLLFKNHPDEPENHKQLVKLGIYRSLKDFLRQCLKGKEDTGLEESILLKYEIEKHW